MGELNWENQTMFTGDNLDIMRGMNSASVHLIYLDPPFNSNANYAAPIGSKAAGAAFKDTWGLDDINLAWYGEVKHDYPGLYALLTATQIIHSDSMMSYLIYMAIRVMEMRRILKPTGSIYLHCDPTASSYLRLLMDAVFGKVNFRNEIAWCYTGPGNVKRWFPRKHHTIYYYAKTNKTIFYRDNVRVPYNSETLARRGRVEGKRSVISPSVRTAGRRNDEEVSSQFGKGKVSEDWWSDIPILTNQRERVGYPTQKPVTLLRRIVRASSNPGDIVLDPFCGCATACIAAEIEGRRWVGIDISAKAAELVQDRMVREVGLFFQGTHRTDIPKRTDFGKIIAYNDIKNKQYLYGEQGGYCHGCEHHFEMRNLTVDHIIPRAKGGTDHISNLQLLCGACNSMKGTRSQEELLAMLTDKGWIKRRKAA